MSVMGGDSQIFIVVSLITEVFVDNMPTTRTFNVVDVVVVVVVVVTVALVPHKHKFVSICVKSKERRHLLHASNTSFSAR